MSQSHKCRDIEGDDSNEETTQPVAIKEKEKENEKEKSTKEEGNKIDTESKDSQESKNGKDNKDDKDKDNKYGKEVKEAKDESKENVKDNVEKVEDTDHDKKEEKEENGKNTKAQSDESKDDSKNRDDEKENKTEKKDADKSGGKKDDKKEESNEPKNREKGHPNVGDASDEKADTTYTVDKAGGDNDKAKEQEDKKDGKNDYSEKEKDDKKESNSLKSQPKSGGKTESKNEGKTSDKIVDKDKEKNDQDTKDTADVKDVKNDKEKDRKKKDNQDKNDNDNDKSKDQGNEESVPKDDNANNNKEKAESKPEETGQKKEGESKTKQENVNDNNKEKVSTEDDKGDKDDKPSKIQTIEIAIAKSDDLVSATTSSPATDTTVTTEAAETTLCNSSNNNNDNNIDSNNSNSHNSFNSSPDIIGSIETRNPSIDGGTVESDGGFVGIDDDENEMGAQSISQSNAQKGTSSALTDLVTSKPDMNENHTLFTTDESKNMRINNVHLNENCNLSIKENLKYVTDAKPSQEGKLRLVPSTVEMADNQSNRSGEEDPNHDHSGPNVHLANVVPLASVLPAPTRPNSNTESKQSEFMKSKNSNRNDKGSNCVSNDDPKQENDNNNKSNKNNKKNDGNSNLRTVKTHKRDSNDEAPVPLISYPPSINNDVKELLENLSVDGKYQQVVDKIVEYELELEDVKTLTVDDLCDMDIDREMARRFCRALNKLNDGAKTESKESKEEKEKENETNTESKSRVGGVIGLYNLGNTCFMNSALQCLLHTPALMNKLIDEIESYKEEVSKLEELTWRNELTVGSNIDYYWEKEDGKSKWIAASIDSIDTLNRRICIKSKWYPQYCEILEESIHLASKKIAKADTKCSVSHWRADLNVNSTVLVEYKRYNYGKKEKVIGTILKEHRDKWEWQVVYTKKHNRNYKTKEWFKNTSELLHPYPLSDKQECGFAQSGVPTNYVNGNGNSFYSTLLEIVNKVHINHGQNREYAMSPEDLHDMLGKQDSTLANGKQNDCGHALSMMLRGLETSMPDKFTFNDELANDKKAHNLFSFVMKDDYFSRNYENWDKNNYDLQFVKKLIASNKLGLNKNVISTTFHLIETIVKTCLNCGFEERNYMESSQLTLPVSDSYILLPIFYFKNSKINEKTIRLPYDATIKLAKFVSLFEIDGKKQGLGQEISNYRIVKLKIGDNNTGLSNFGEICDNSEKISKCFGYLHNNYVAFLVNKRRITSKKCKQFSKSKHEILYLDTCVEKESAPFLLQVINVDSNVKESMLIEQLVKRKDLLLEYDFYLNGKKVSGSDMKCDYEYILECHKENGMYQDGVNQLNVLVRVERILGMKSSDEDREYEYLYNDNNRNNGSNSSYGNTKASEDIITAVIEGCQPFLVGLTPKEIKRRMKNEMVGKSNFKNEILIAYSRIAGCDKHDKSIQNDLINAQMVLKNKINQFVKYVSNNKVDLFFSVFEKKLTTLEKCLDVYGKRVIGGGQECDFFTNGCQCKSQHKFISTKRKLTRGPLVLTIKLDRTDSQSKKQEINIKFGETLNLINNDNYNLYAISKHSAFTGKFGHYWASVKRLGTNEWWNCNDSSCYKIGKFTCDNAILIMYQRE